MKPDQGSSEPQSWEQSTVPTSYRSSGSSKIPDIQSFPSRQGIRCSTPLLKRSRNTHRCGVISPTWHSTGVSAWTENIQQYGNPGAPTRHQKELVRLFDVLQYPGRRGSFQLFISTKSHWHHRQRCRWCQCAL